MEIGYTLMTEQRGPQDLVRDAVAAERAGFDFLVASDHFHPLARGAGARPRRLAGARRRRAGHRRRIPFMTYVTCPIVRYHPAVVAQQAATLGCSRTAASPSASAPGRTSTSTSSAAAGRPPTCGTRCCARRSRSSARSGRAAGPTTAGQHFSVESAKLYDLPETPVRIGVAASGRQSCALAADLGDYLIGTEPKPELREHYRAAGGTGEQVGQFPVRWDADADAAQTLLRDQFRWAALGWKVQAELPGPPAFDAASQFVRPEDMAQAGAWGPDVAPYLEKLQAFADAGYSRVALVQVGDRQEEFCEWVASELAPAARSL